MAGISPNWNALYSNQGIRLQGNPALDDLRQRYATQQAQKAQDNANFTAQIAKLNFGGAKDADLDYLHKQYGDILNTFGQLRNSNDPKQRAQLGLQLQQKQNGFLYDIEKSKDANKQAMDATNLLHNPNADLTDDAPNKILALHGKSSFDKDYQDVYNNTMTGLFNPKTVDVGKGDDEIFNRIKNSSTSTGSTIQDPVTKEYVKPTLKITAADKEDYLNQQIAAARDPKRGKQLMKQYGTSDIAEAVAKHVAITWPVYEKKLGTDTTYSQPFETGATKALRTLGNEERLAAWKKTNGIGTIEQPVPAPQTVPITFKNTNSDKSPVTMNIRNYTPISIPKATMIPTKGTDDSGNEVSIPAGEVRVIGQGEKPVLNSDITTIKNGVKSTVKKGSIAQPAYEAAHPDHVTYKKIYHVQQDHKGHTKNYYIPVTSIGINNSGQKSQTQAIQGNKKKTSADYGL